MNADKKLADRYSLRSFMNSLLRDYHEDHFIEQTHEDISLSLGPGESLKVFLEKDSLLGLHQYAGIIEHHDHLRKKIKSLSFDDFVSLVARLVFKIDRPEEFVSQVLSSRDNMEKILRHQRGKEAGELSGLEASEQSLYLGHPFHPFPKAKIGMTDEDMGRYSPEFQTQFPILWLAVKRDLLQIPPSDEGMGLWPWEVFQFDFRNSGSEKFDILKMIAEGYCPLPAHPWQMKRMAQIPLIASYLKNGEIIELGRGGHFWKPTSSLRSLFCEKAPYLLKFSLSVKLTNSVRDLKIKESMRGLMIARVLKDEKLAPFFEKYKRFSILNEPSFAGIIDRQTGEVIPQSLVLARENFQEGTDLSKLFLLAGLVEERSLRALIEKNSEREKISLELSLKKWFQKFLENVLEPFLVLAADHGVLLGAHLQNIIVGLEDGYPVQVTFKDCQGTGFSPLGYQEFKESCPLLDKENGNILGDDDVNKIFIYYIVINTVWTTISSATLSDKKGEKKLLNDFRNFLFRLSRSGLKDRGFFDFVLQSDFLFQKGNFRCSIHGFNETTMDNPPLIYNKIPNPFKTQLRQIRSYPQETVYDAFLDNLKSRISLRVFNFERHMDKFYQWHHQKFVSEFWELDKTREELTTYMENLLNSPYQLPLIFEVDGSPVGYFEVYWAFDDRIAPYCDPDLYDRGVHLLIGEEKYLRSKFMLAGILAVCRFIFEDDPRTQNIWGEPRADNKKMLRISEVIPGWRFVREFDFPHKRAALIQCPRERFYQEIGQWKY